MSNRYKEQMSKISVDDEMKKRVMNKIRKTQENKNEKNFIFQGQAFCRYGGVVAACCAFVVTYAVTMNYPELINNHDRILIEDEYSIDDTEDQSPIEEHDNLTYEKNDEISIFEDNFNEEKEKNYKDNKSETIVNNEQVIDSNKNTLGDNVVVVIGETTDTEENRDNNIKEIDNTQKQDASVTHNNSISDKGNEEVQNYNEIEQAEDDDNSKVKTASYHYEESKQRGYLFQRGVPDLSDRGLYINYVNQISQNEVEIMYSDDKRNLWIKICDEEDDELKNNNMSTHDLEENIQETSRDNYEKNNYVIYRKDNKSYYIWSNVNMDDKFIDDIIKNI